MMHIRKLVFAMAVGSLAMGCVTDADEGVEVGGIVESESAIRSDMDVPERGGTKHLSDSTRLLSFSVTIATIDGDASGTDADVYLELAGQDYLLDKEDYNDFESGDTDTY